MKLALIASALMLLAGSAMAQAIEMPAGAASPSAGSKDDGEKIICRTEELAGQRFKTKVCHTKTQWAALGEYGRSVVEASQMGASSHVCSGGAC